MSLGPSPSSYTRDVSVADLELAKHCIKARQYDVAEDMILTYLDFYPQEEAAIYLLGLLFEEQGRPGAAANILEPLTHTSDRWEVHHRYGMALDDLHLPEHAKPAHERALKLSPGNKEVILSLATSCAQAQDVEQTLHWSEQALLHGVDESRARVQMAYAQLIAGDYAEGWQNYAHGIGRQKWRPDRRYNCDEPRWTGDEGERVVFHGEQGIGDQIAFLTCIGDVKAEIVALDVSEKIRGLIARSFPEINVIGDLDSPELRQPISDFDSSQTISYLPALYRKSLDDYPSGRYLVADPQRRVMARALLDSLPERRNIGIAWSGGNRYTQRHARTAPLEAMLPILRREGINWISLEYRDNAGANWAEKHGITIHDFPWFTRSVNYDDTAALIAELDAVISVPTTAVHCAGALGVPVHCMVLPRPPIHYGGETDRMCWYHSVKLYRRKDYSIEEWQRVITEIGAAL